MKVLAITLAGAMMFFTPSSQRTSMLHPERGATGDLEVGGAIAGGQSAFIPYQSLVKLPRTKFVASNDSNFPAPAHLSGVPLEQLERDLAVGADMVLAICKDGYRSNYPSAYLAAHHPVLVLTVNGKPPEEWPKAEDGAVLGPYVIANPDFKPSFKVLSHTDEAQIPFEVVRLEFRRQQEVLGPITPQGSYAADSAVMQGFQIAQQNCYRCHNMGAEGGQMAHISWPMIGMFAKSNPDFFAKYVRAPQAVNPNSRMAGSPHYDDPTIAALRAYFTTFAAGEKQQ